MAPKKRLWRLSAVLLLINIVLAGFTLFNYFDHNRILDNLREDLRKNEEVLGTATSIPTFNNGFVLSDDTFRSTRVFPTEQSVQAYLDSVNSPLRNFTDQGQRASFWIFGAARGTTSAKFGITPQINPGVILAFLEKEQSLISLRNYDVYSDPERRIRTAMGYGCPDTARCDQVYFGFANQVNWGAYQLELNFQQAGTNGGGTPYIVQKTITTLDEYNVFIQNRATAAVYRYTPHVYWGNYNLWKIITANGWGVDPNRYSFADLDRENLAGKDIKVAENIERIPLERVDRILRTSYRLGDVSEDIRLLQQFLRQEGFYSARVSTGLYGTVTQSAHTSYLNSRGIVLENPAQTPQTSDSCRALYSQQWQQGTFYGENGRALQQCLRVAGFFNWPANTGLVGEVTIAALNQARSSFGIIESSGQQQTDSCDRFKTVQWQFGTLSEEVRQLQSCMRRAGVFSWAGGDTGYFGTATQEAFRRWTGTTSQPTVNNTPCDSLKTRTFTLGQSGSDISLLQGCMRRDGVFNWPSGDTGFYGPVTAEAFARWTGRSFEKQFSCEDLKTQVWVRGENSQRVRQLQQCMRDAGVFNWRFGNTGFFGEATQQALIQWRGYF